MTGPNIEELQRRARHLRNEVDRLELRHKGLMAEARDVDRAMGETLRTLRSVNALLNSKVAGTPCRADCGRQVQSGEPFCDACDGIVDLPGLASA